MRPRLRIFRGEDDIQTIDEPPVTVSLRDITQVLRDAIDAERTWVRDFEDDEVQISADLYDVLSAYWHLRPSA